MSDDFKVGDVAVCIAEPQGDHQDIFWEPKVGGIYKVCSVSWDGAGIELAEDPDKFDPEGDWDVYYFKKLPPAEPEFISLIRSLGVPKRVREDA